MVALVGAVAAAVASLAKVWSDQFLHLIVFVFVISIVIITAVVVIIVVFCPVINTDVIVIISAELSISL